jgi:hypothetical protein
VPPCFLDAGLVDLVFLRVGFTLRNPVYGALLGGVVHVTTPLVMLAIAAVADASFGFMRFGNYFPLITHFAFGAIGAAAGVLLAQGYLSKRA